MVAGVRGVRRALCRGLRLPTLACLVRGVPGQGGGRTASARVSGPLPMADGDFRRVILWVPDRIHPPTFQTHADRVERVISKLSMGGFGAIKPASHPSALWRPSDVGDDAGSELHRLFGNRPAGVPTIFCVGGVFRRRVAGVAALRTDCETEEGLLAAPNREVCMHLDQLEMAHEHAGLPGGMTGASGRKSPSRSLVFRRG